MPLQKEYFFGADRFQLESCQQPVMAGRFQWEEVFRVDEDPDHLGPLSEGGKEKVLIISDGSCRVDRWYDPIADEPALFLEFAHLAADLSLDRGQDATADRIQEFANKRGPLRDWDSFTTSILPGRGKGRLGHSWPAWVSESRSLWDAVQLWEWTGRSRPDGKADHRKLKKAIIWEDKKNRNTNRVETLVKYVSQHGSRKTRFHIASSIDPRAGSNVLSTWKVGEILRPARFWLAERITRKLMRDVSPGFVFAPNPNKPSPAILPHNLRGALWYQFYRAYSGEFPLARCLAPDCGKWMKYERRTKQMHKDCANRMRVRRCRAKKASRA
jgi:hypothetical protein